MNRRDLMVASIQYPTLYKKYTLTERNRSMLRFIASNDPRGTTSRDIADEYKISIQNAQGQLAKLERKGFLYRLHSDHETGGTEYIYFIYSNLAEVLNNESN